VSNLAAIITAVATLLTVVFSFVLQMRQARRTDKKIDAGAVVAAESSRKLDEVHASTNVLVASATGSHPIYKP